jgi:hypothetical protein
VNGYVYQAYQDVIADAALKNQRFVSRFSLGRMTWNKPSFLWLMERSGWGTKSNQERILAVRTSRHGFDQALSLGVLTHFEEKGNGTSANWQQAMAESQVHIQWDTERSLRGAKLEHRAIQIGISRSLIEEYVSEWVEKITDLTPLVAKLRQLHREGRYDEARRLLPAEQVYPVEQATAQRLDMDR